MSEIRDEHSREDELMIQIIGLQGKIECLKKEKEKLIEKFIGRLQNLLERKESYSGEFESFIIEEIEEYKKSL